MGRCSYNETGPAERLLFMWLWSGGVSFRSIARQTRRSPTTVRRWVRRLLGDHLNGIKCNQMDVGSSMTYRNTDDVYFLKFFEEISYDQTGNVLCDAYDSRLSCSKLFF